MGLQSNLKKLSCNTIPGIEEVNLFKGDGTVIHFVAPKVDAEVSSNTFIVSGNYTHNKIEELLPDILPQIGSDHLNQLKDYAEKFEALKPQNDDGDVPMLIDEDLNFETVAASDEKKEEKADDKVSDDAANGAADSSEQVKDDTQDGDADVAIVDKTTSEKKADDEAKTAAETTESTTEDAST